MIASCALKARVEERLGAALDPGFFDRAEQYARRKLDLCNERAGRTDRGAESDDRCSRDNRAVLCQCADRDRWRLHRARSRWVGR